MSLANDSLLAALAQEGIPVYDNAAATGTTASTGQRLFGQAVRVTTSAGGGNGVVVLPSLLTNEAPGMWWVINDSPNTILIAPFNNTTNPEKQNGTNNQTLSVGTGTSAHGFKVTQTARGGGATNTIDWRSANIP